MFASICTKTIQAVFGFYRGTKARFACHPCYHPVAVTHITSCSPSFTLPVQPVIQKPALLVTHVTPAFTPLLSPLTSPRCCHPHPCLQPVMHPFFTRCCHPLLLATMCATAIKRSRLTLDLTLPIGQDYVPRFFSWPIAAEPAHSVTEAGLSPQVTPSTEAVPAAVSALSYSPIPIAHRSCHLTPTERWSPVWQLYGSCHLTPHDSCRQLYGSYSVHHSSEELSAQTLAAAPGCVSAPGYSAALG